MSQSTNGALLHSAEFTELAGDEEYRDSRTPAYRAGWVGVPFSPSATTTFPALPRRSNTIGMRASRPTRGPGTPGSGIPAARRTCTSATSRMSPAGQATRSPSGRTSLRGGTDDGGRTFSLEQTVVLGARSTFPGRSTFPTASSAGGPRTWTSTSARAAPWGWSWSPSGRDSAKGEIYSERFGGTPTCPRAIRARSPPPGRVSGGGFVSTGRTG